MHEHPYFWYKLHVNSAHGCDVSVYARILLDHAMQQSSVQTSFPVT